MKFAIFFALLALSICNPPVSTEELDLQVSNEIIDILKCLLDKATPIIPEISQFIEAYKAKDLVKLIEIIQKLSEEGKEAYLECIPHSADNLGLKVNFKCLQGCGINFLSKGVPACFPLVLCLIPGVGLPACAVPAFNCAYKVPDIGGRCLKCFKF